MTTRKRGNASTPNTLTSYADRFATYTRRAREEADSLVATLLAQHASDGVQPSAQPGEPDDAFVRARRSVGEIVPIDWLEEDWELQPEPEAGVQNVLRLVPRFDTGRPGLFLRVLLDPSLLLARALGKRDPMIYEAVRFRSPQSTGYSEAVVRGPGCTRDEVDDAIARALMPYLARH